MRNLGVICATVAASLLAMLAVAGCGGGSKSTPTSTTTSIHGPVAFTLRYPAGGTFAATGAITDSGSSMDAFPGWLEGAVGPAAKPGHRVKGAFTRTLVGKQGTIVFKVTGTVVAAKGDSGTWVVTSGTGRYAGLHGSGSQKDIGGVPPNSGTMVGQLSSG